MPDDLHTTPLADPLLADPPVADVALGDLPVVRDTRFREATAAPRRRHGVGLCLSGGGYRAALLHLGALRRLDELGILAQVRTVSGVSGGSLAAATLAHPGLVWPAPGVGGARVTGFDELVAGTVRRLTSCNLRTLALLAGLAPGVGGPQALARLLAARPPFDQQLAAVRPGPRIAISSTDLVFGVDWVEWTASVDAPARVGSYRAGHAAPQDGWRLADSCASSCAEPPWFAPRRVPERLGLRLSGGHREVETAEQHRALRRGLQLVDGGVYDNLGLEPVWRDHAQVLVSDGGGVFRARSQRTVLGRLLRSLEVVGRSDSNTRLRWLHAAFARDVLGGCTWGVDDVADYPLEVVEAVARVRTDLDAFSPGEQQVLERHGYCVAEQAVRRHAASLVRLDTPFEPPHPQVAEPAAALAALRGSERRSLLGRW